MMKFVAESDLFRYIIRRATSFSITHIIIRGQQVIKFCQFLPPVVHALDQCSTPGATAKTMHVNSIPTRAWEGYIVQIVYFVKYLKKAFCYRIETF